MNLKHLYLVIFIFTSFGCASKLSLTSNPPAAEVELISPVDQVSASLGKTPLLLTPDDLAEKQTRGPYVLRVSKDGFLSREILIMSISGVQATINLQLRSNEPSRALNDAVNGLFHAQELAQTGEYQASLDALTEIQKVHPGIVAVYELKGSIFMLRGEYEAAARELAKATQFEPDNPSLKQLYQTALQKNGGHLPASVQTVKQVKPVKKAGH